MYVSDILQQDYPNALRAIRLGQSMMELCETSVGSTPAAINDPRFIMPSRSFVLGSIRMMIAIPTPAAQLALIGDVIRQPQP